MSVRSWVDPVEFAMRAILAVFDADDALVDAEDGISPEELELLNDHVKTALLDAERAGVRPDVLARIVDVDPKTLGKNLQRWRSRSFRREISRLEGGDRQ